MVRIVKQGDVRFNQVGKVIFAEAAGAMVQFGDSRVEGFKASSFVQVPPECAVRGCSALSAIGSH